MSEPEATTEVVDSPKPASEPKTKPKKAKILLAVGLCYLFTIAAIEENDRQGAVDERKFVGKVASLSEGIVGIKVLNNGNQSDVRVFSVKGFAAAEEVSAQIAYDKSFEAEYSA